MKKEWKDIAVGDVFDDGSVVKSVHEHYNEECYKVFYSRNKECVLSKSHLLLCDISHCNQEVKNWVEEHFGQFLIPTLYDKHVYMHDLDDMINKGYVYKDELVKESYEVVKADPSKVSDTEYWLPVEALVILLRNFKQKVLCNKKLLQNIEYMGELEVFCVETDTHRFNTCGLIHHNSVTLRNVIFHCLTHGDQIAIALVDLKFTEFTYFKGVKNVVAVANTVKETVEIMRIARECMYKRNQELAKLGLTDIKDFHPQKPTDEVSVAGRKLHDNDKVEIRMPSGETKEITVKELEKYL